jgi:hypothetical protein
MMGYREMGKVLNVSQVTAYNHFHKALAKVAYPLFVELRGREPTHQELMDLVKDDGFQELVAEVLREKK